MWLVQIFARYLCLNFLVSLFQFSPPLEQCQVLLDLSNILNNVLNNIFSKSWTTSWAFFVGLEYDHCLALLLTHPIWLRHWYFGQIIRWRRRYVQFDSLSQQLFELMLCFSLGLKPSLRPILLIIWFQNMQKWLYFDCFSTRYLQKSQRVSFLMLF